MNATKPYGAFVSYSRNDGEFAMKLASELKSAGQSVWLDQLDIPTGARWDDEVEEALNECQVFLIILTPKSVSSNHVKDEIGYAIDHDKLIMPVLLEKCNIPLRLRRFQYVDFTEIEFREGVRRVKQLLEALLNELSKPEVTINPEPQKAYEPAAIPPGPAFKDNRLQQLLAKLEETDNRHELSEEILTLFENVVKAIGYDHFVLTDTVLAKLAEVSALSHYWARGELSYIGIASNKMLLQMYKQAQENVFATVVPEYNEHVWMKPLGDKLLQAHKASKANQVTRVFIFDHRSEFTERHLAIMERHVNANVAVRIYFDKEDPSYDLPADLPEEMLRDFTIIDDGKAIGVTKSIRPKVIESTWYFGRKDKISFYEDIEEKLMDRSEAFEEVKAWWATRTAGGQ